MEVKDIVIKRYTPSQGKALKITRNIQRFTDDKEEYIVYTSLSTLVVEDELIVPVEEVDMKEYDEWAKNRRLNTLGITSLI